MDRQGHRTGTFAVTQTFDVSHAVDKEGAKRWREERVHHTMMGGVSEILEDGRCYEIRVTTSTILGGAYPPGIATDGAPQLGRPQGTPLYQIHSQYTVTSRAIIVLADPREAEVGECVSIGAFSMPLEPEGDPLYRMKLWREDEPDWVFERVKVGWKRIS